MGKKMTAFQFFYLHAGYSYVAASETELQGRRRCAKELVAAEAAARDAGYSFAWSVDPCADSSDHSEEAPPYALWVCTARDGQGKIAGSVGAVDFGRDGEPWGQPYRRVVEAELAMEALGNEANEPEGSRSQG